MRIVLADTTASGNETARLLLDDLPSPLSLRHLVCHRVREEVARYNAHPAPRFNGHGQPTTAEALVVGRNGGELPYVVSESNLDLLRAACWAAGAVAAVWAVPAVHAVGGRSAWGASPGVNGYVASAKIPNACVYALGLVGSEPAIAGLPDLQRTVKHAGFRQQIGAALAAA